MADQLGAAAPGVLGIVVSGLAGLVSMLAMVVSWLTARLWKALEDKVAAQASAVDAVEKRLAGHQSIDDGQHHDIRRSIAEEIHRLHTKIDTRTNQLSEQITESHRDLGDKLFNVMALLTTNGNGKGDRK